MMNTCRKPPIRRPAGPYQGKCVLCVQCLVTPFCPWVLTQCESHNMCVGMGRFGTVGTIRNRPIPMHVCLTKSHVEGPPRDDNRTWLHRFQNRVKFRGTECSQVR
jgi:hypothetical protein